MESKNNIDLDKFEDYIKNTPLIGEIGLDFHWVEENIHIRIK